MGDARQLRPRVMRRLRSCSRIKCRARAANAGSQTTARGCFGECVGQAGGQSPTRAQRHRRALVQPSFASRSGGHKSIFFLVVLNRHLMDLHARIEYKKKLEAEREKRIGADAARLMPPPSTRAGDTNRVRDQRIVHTIVADRDDRDAFLRFTRATRAQQNQSGQVEQHSPCQPHHPKKNKVTFITAARKEGYSSTSKKEADLNRSPKKVVANIKI